MKARKPSRNQPPGRGVGGAELEARRSQRLKTAELLGSGRTPLRVIETAGHAAQLAERALDEALASEPPRPPLACQEGCDWCCHKVVGVAAPEVLRIAAYLREHLAEPELQEVTARAEAHAEKRRAFANDPWAADRLPCPLLVVRRCIAYPVRPLTCRGYTSSDARRCERAATTRQPTAVPTHGLSLRLTTFILDGMRAGVTEAGLAGDRLLLAEALRIALTTPNLTERWLAGEPVFAQARLS
jgi:Fe-S-cluster containining protein